MLQENSYQDEFFRLYLEILSRIISVLFDILPTEQPANNP
jgi:hypothetical protein